MCSSQLYEQCQASKNCIKEISTVDIKGMKTTLEPLLNTDAVRLTVPLTRTIQHTTYNVKLWKQIFREVISEKEN